MSACDEEVRVGRVHDHDANLVVCGHFGGEAAELDDQAGVQQIDRRIIDGRATDAVADHDSNVLIVPVGHGQTLCDEVVMRLSSGFGGPSR